MTQTLTQIAGTLQTVMSTELNSLASTAIAISSVAGASGIITLTSAGYPMAFAELLVGFGGSPTANSTINVWFLTSIDGANMEDGGGTVIPQRSPDLFFPLRALSSPQRLTKICKLPVTAFRVLVQNNSTGQTMNSSGNTLKLLPFTSQIG